MKLNKCYLCDMKIEFGYEKWGKLVNKKAEQSYCAECYYGLQEGIKLYRERQAGKYGDWKNI